MDALVGRPGIYSSRFAGVDATDQDNIIKLLQELREIPREQYQARFQCIMVLLRSVNDPTPIICQGTWEGEIIFNQGGSNGFGYDPVFWVQEYKCTSAQLSPEIKNRISRRAQAIQKMSVALNKKILL